MQIEMRATASQPQSEATGPPERRAVPREPLIAVEGAMLACVRDMLSTEA